MFNGGGRGAYCRGSAGARDSLYSIHKGGTVGYILKIAAQREFVSISVEGGLNLLMLQKHVGGLIEICYDPIQATPKGLTGLCDEEGLLKGLEPMMMTSERGIIVGPIIWVMTEGDDFVTLNTKQRVEAAEFLTQQGFTETVMH